MVTLPGKTERGVLGAHLQPIVYSCWVLGVPRQEVFTASWEQDFGVY